MIFERPLDPYLQEGSNIPSNAKMSIVTSDSNLIREQESAKNCRNNGVQIHDKDLTMSRMNWLWALRPLFDSLQAFHTESRKRHVEKNNFLDALRKVKPTLELKQAKPANEINEVEISFAVAFYQFEDHLPEYFTWDNLFDVLLFQTVASQFVYDLQGYNDQEIDTNDLNETSCHVDSTNFFNETEKMKISVDQAMITNVTSVKVPDTQNSQP